MIFATNCYVNYSDKSRTITKKKINIFVMLVKGIRYKLNADIHLQILILFCVTKFHYVYLSLQSSYIINNML